ncbi:MAG: FkbM family methyltransferase [Mesorhizobium sp.]|uniref:FkbM family methyltransferase n=1 Tax=Mesorhizobium sp. TaxID=1871066 RepID=UPI000FE86A0E|nr:FkbM family methyltransferase [Mesorhizobium sp.]RWM09961.1 MAG: FkbM family methyltransferase [Mesorhizobium sp.]TIP69203.1 MAG: FkbM family methyltransferase [Mesorhizobium sp.]TIQ02834.1 MAG: FkbM family methyltransferase [Mesorhizobium sp.]TIR52222.1 MAG: FkbM family methyltransferase [Mesorhizobium sp.]TJV91224.1 MAG: FkbM family methyltransferase [Mesorhizobium sp.]
MGKIKRSLEVLRTEGPVRLLQLSALSLIEPLRSQGLRPRVASDAKQALSHLNLTKRSRGLFIDCGSNIGQGFRFFSTYYTPDKYDYVLIEPNKNCLAQLNALRAKNLSMEIIPKAASVKDGYAELFGPPPDRSEATHQSCSIVLDHNGSLYQSHRFAPDLVETFSLSQMIRTKRRLYDVIVLKLDVEGAEYEILDDLIRAGVHRDLYAAYVEFHSLKLRNPARREKRALEARMVKAFDEAGIRFRRWI